MKRRSLAQFWRPDLSNQERNQGGKIGSCIAMEAEILEIDVSMQKWCEALSAVSHLHEMCAAQMATSNFDLNHCLYILLCCWILFVSFNCRKRK